MEYNILKDILQPLAIILGGIFALYQYRQQQKFKRLQNLSSLWKGFSGDNDLLTLFNLMDEIESGNTALQENLKTTERRIKFKYLALIEEVSLYVNEFEVDKDFAKYLFQWHFFYLYQSSATSSYFWDNMGGDKEKNADYWIKSRTLSASIKPQ